MDAGDPHTIAETRIRPTWTLDVQPDGTVSPRLPTEIGIRDGALLRPVAPFLELWALTGDGPESALTPVPLTPALLTANGASEAAISFTIEAVNRKAARRTGRPGLRFGTFPPVQVRADNHAPVRLLGVSPPNVAQPMIPAGRSIPLGQVQVLRPAPQPAGQPWSATVRIDVVRLRFTPALGRIYGPPRAAQVRPPAVPPDRAFLNPAAGWQDAARGTRVVPADTVDEDRWVPRSGSSTTPATPACWLLWRCPAAPCGAWRTSPSARRISRPTGGRSSPWPTRSDRQHDPQRDASLNDADRAEWVEDLFERVFETASLMDVDFWRTSAARQLPADERRTPIPGDGVPQPERAMGGADQLRDPNIAIPAPSRDIPLPLSERARDRHRNLSDLGTLEPWVRGNPGRLRQLIRPPFASPPRDDAGQSMQMPPFMRNSNARALSLARWQYDLLMAWVDAVTQPLPSGFAPPAEAPAPAGPVAPAPGGPVAPLSPAAAERRQQVLASLDAGGDQSPEDAGGGQ